MTTLIVEEQAGNDARLTGGLSPCELALNSEHISVLLYFQSIAAALGSLGQVHVFGLRCK